MREILATWKSPNDLVSQARKRQTGSFGKAKHQIEALQTLTGTPFDGVIEGYKNLRKAGALMPADGGTVAAHNGA